MKTLSRRTVLKMAVANAAVGLDAHASPSQECAEAVPTDRGPFYPRSDIEETTNLVQRLPNGPRAVGQVIDVFGTISDIGCEPLPDVEIVIWQADASGFYRHPRGKGQSQLDPNFRYFARSRTNASGEYRFTTIIPSPYEFQGLKRARHIHFEIRCPQRGHTATEMYFAGSSEDQRRLQDEVWLSRSPRLRNSLITSARGAEQLSTSESSSPADVVPAFRFDISMPE